MAPTYRWYGVGGFGGGGDEQPADNAAMIAAAVSHAMALMMVSHEVNG
jgi:hypothetical protein